MKNKTFIQEGHKQLQVYFLNSVLGCTHNDFSILLESGYIRAWDSRSMSSVLAGKEGDLSVASNYLSDFKGEVDRTRKEARHS